MLKFIKTRLMTLLEESATKNSSISVSEWKQSYKAFAEEVFDAGKNRERAEQHRTLCLLRAELLALQSQICMKKK